MTCRDGIDPQLARDELPEVIELHEPVAERIRIRGLHSGLVGVQKGCEYFVPVLLNEVNLQQWCENGGQFVLSTNNS